MDKKFNSVSKSAAKPASVPKPTRVVLPNGMVLIVQENHANKTVALSGYVRAGSMYDPDGKYGTAEMTAAMLGRGTATQTALQLALSLEVGRRKCRHRSRNGKSVVFRCQPVAGLRPDFENAGR